MKEFTAEEIVVYWLNSIKSINFKTRRKLLEFFEDVNELYNSTSDFKSQIITNFGEEVYNKLILASSVDYKEIILNELNNLKVDIITALSDDYPESFADIIDPPLILYYQGNIKLLNEPKVVIIGSRIISTYGKDVAVKMTKELVEHDVVIVAGIADGIDNIVVRTATENQGRVIVFAAGGIDTITPKINSELADIVKLSGLVVSDQPCGVVAMKHHYLSRNRLFVGVSDATILIEAGENSNTMSACYLAAETKELFAIPHSIFSQSGAGGNKLLANGSASLLIDSNQVLEYLRSSSNFIIKVKQSDFENKSESSSEICKLLFSGKMHIDTICDALEKEQVSIVMELFNLEAFGIIRKLPGNFYEIVNK